MFFVNRQQCAGCGLCSEACPQQAIRIQDGAAFIDQELCAGCGTCRAVCSNEAIYEVEAAKPVAAPVVRRQSAPLARTGFAAFPGNEKKAALVRVLTALAPVVLEGLHGLVSRRAGKGEVFKDRQGQSGRGRGCRRRRKCFR